MLGIPHIPTEPRKEFRGSVEGTGYLVEKWIYESKPGSWVTALLYLPARTEEKCPVVLVTNGHGESKSTLAHLDAGAVFADSGVRPMSPDQLRCLSREEVGDPRFTLEGWLDRL